MAAKKAPKKVNPLVDSDDDLEILDLDEISEDREPMPFMHGGERFELPADADVKWVEYLDAGAVQQSLYTLLGPAEYERLDAVEKPLTAKKIGALLERYSKHLGLDLGKSGGRGKSSKLITER